jgi:hypothetical protein
MVAEVAQGHAIQAAVNGSLGDRITYPNLPVEKQIATSVVDVMQNLERRQDFASSVSFINDISSSGAANQHDGAASRFFHGSWR